MLARRGWVGERAMVARSRPSETESDGANKTSKAVSQENIPKANLESGPLTTMDTDVAPTAGRSRVTRERNTRRSKWHY